MRLIPLLAILGLVVSCQLEEREKGLIPGTYRSSSNQNTQMSLADNGTFVFKGYQENCPSIFYSGRWFLDGATLKLTDMQTRTFAKCDTAKFEVGSKEKMLLDIRNVDETGFESYSASNPAKQGTRWQKAPSISASGTATPRG